MTLDPLAVNFPVEPLAIGVCSAVSPARRNRNLAVFSTGSKSAWYNSPAAIRIMRPGKKGTTCRPLPRRLA